MKFILFVCALVLAGAQAAWGHAALLETTPPAGAVLEQAPADATLVFNEPVGVTVVRLVAPDGKTLPTGAVRDENQRVSVRLPPVSAPGTYLLSWRVVSADGHPVGGTLSYALGAPSAQAASAAPDRTRRAAIWLARWLTYACLFAVVGAALFRLLQRDDRQRWARPLVLAGWALLALDLGLQGLDLLDAPFGALLQPHTWAVAFASSYGWTVGLMALALLTASAVIDAMRPQAAYAGAPLALLLAGAAVAASGHAGTAPPRWLSRPLVAAHVILAIAWIGALVPLARLLFQRARSGGAGLAALARFSRGIVPIVALLAASGVGLAWLQLVHVSDLWSTPYGRVLLAKLGLIALLLALAASNRWCRTRPALAGDVRQQKRLAQTTTAEAAVALLVLAVVALWRLTPPPRSLEAVAAQAPAALQFKLEDGRVHARIVQDGASTWRIALQHPDGKPFAAQEVTLELANPEAGIEALDAKAAPGAPGAWSAHLPPLPPVGAWHARLTVLVDDFTQITLTDSPAHAAVPAHGHGGGDMATDEPGTHGHGMHGGGLAVAAPGTQAPANHPPDDALTIDGCWVRLLPAAVPSGAYFTVRNASAHSVTINGAASPDWGRVMLHRSTEKGGVSRMDMSGPITIPAHGSFTFEPGGYHVMLEQPIRPMRAGATTALRLLTSAGKAVRGTCALRAASATHQ